LWARQSRDLISFFSPPQGRVYYDPNSAWARKRVKRKKRSRGRCSPQPKDLDSLEVGTIVRFNQGIKSDVYNALDIRLRFQFSFAYQKANSPNTA
jgi:hypothetical protein